MPFPANWLEELVVEWLELEGFATTTAVIIPAGARSNAPDLSLSRAGGRFVPDAVGARLIDGRLLIRHCEAAMYLIAAPKDVAKRYVEKFSQQIESAVRTHFARIFGESAAQDAIYEKWVITCGASQPVKGALATAVPNVRIYMLNDFVRNELLPCIEEWRKPPNTKTTTLPADRWLLGLIDHFSRSGLLSSAVASK
jgi:hypothetical protein